MSDTITVPADPQYPATVGERAIAEFVIKPQGFTSYAEAIRRAQKAPGDLTTAVWRDWLTHQVEARDSDGATVSFGIADALAWPAPYGPALLRLQNASTAQPGEIVRDGNGVDEPCTFRLGTPLPAGEGAEITELEFFVRIIGDVEAVMSADTTLDQALALIETCATPLGGDVTLLRLPGAMITSLTLADGVAIMEGILPRFLQ